MLLAPLARCHLADVKQTYKQTLFHEFVTQVIAYSSLLPPFPSQALTNGKSIYDSSVNQHPRLERRVFSSSIAVMQEICDRSHRILRKNLTEAGRNLQNILVEICKGYIVL